MIYGEGSESYSISSTSDEAVGLRIPIKTLDTEVLVGSTPYTLLHILAERATLSITMAEDNRKLHTWHFPRLCPVSLPLASLYRSPVTNHNHECNSFQCVLWVLPVNYQTWEHSSEPLELATGVRSEGCLGNCPSRSATPDSVDTFPSMGWEDCRATKITSNW